MDYTFNSILSNLIKERNSDMLYINELDDIMLSEKASNRGFPGGSDDKESACNAGHQGSIPGSGRYPGKGNGTPLEYSCLENSMDRGAWQATVHGVTKSQHH